MKKLIISLTAMSLLLFIISGPALSGPKYGNTLVWNHNGGMSDINPPADGGTLLSRNLSAALEPLLRFDESGVLIGHLAESWDVSPDGRQITIYLRKGIKFHDGTDFNAEAVKFNLEKSFEVGVAGSANLGKVQSYEVIDDHTLRINIASFDFRVLNTLAGIQAVGLIASPTALRKPSTPENRARLHMVGTGPFMFDTWRRDDFVRFKKNPNYWKPGLPYLDAVEIRSVADSTVSIMAFQSGASNLVENIPPDDAKMLKAKGYNITSAGLRFIHAFFPSGGNPDSPFADKRVREALIYALDKQKLVDGIGGGIEYGYIAVDTFSAPDNLYHPDIEPRLYNKEKAKQLLADAGYPNGFKTNFYVEVRLSPKEWAEAIQTSLKEVGIDAAIQIMDVPRFTELTRSGWDGIAHRGFPFPGNIPSIFAGIGNPQEFVSMYRPEGYNELCESIVVEPDEKKRIELVKQLNKIVYDEVTAIPYRANSPLKVDDGTVRDPKLFLHVGAWPDAWWPEVLWLDK